MSRLTVKLCVYGVVGAAFLFGGKEGAALENEALAAKEAVTFADRAFIKCDFVKSYEGLHIAAKKEVTLDGFRKLIAAMHPNGFPTMVAATAYEHLDNEAGMKIGVVGRKGAETLYYEFTVAGSDKAGYRVTRFFRFDGGFPRAPKRQRLPQVIRPEGGNGTAKK